MVKTVREPRTGKEFPTLVEHGDLLCGTGARVKRIGFVDVNVYGMALYVDPVGAWAHLKEFEGLPGSELASRVDFYSKLIAAPFRKTIVLTIARYLSDSQVSGGFSESFIPRLGEHKYIFDSLSRLLLGQLFTNDTQVMFIMDNGTFTLKINDKTLGTIESSELVTAALSVYLDDNPISPEGKKSLVARMPKILALGAAAEAENARGVSHNLEAASSAVPQLNGPSAGKSEKGAASNGALPRSLTEYGEPDIFPAFKERIRRAEKDFFDEVSETGNWVFQAEKRGIQSYAHIKGDGTMMGKGVIPYSPRHVLNVILDVEKKGEWDYDLDHGKRVKVFNKQCNLDYLCYKAVWPTAARDFVSIVQWFTRPHDGSVLVIALHHEDGAVPEKNGNVRGRCLLGVWHIIPREENTQSHVTFLVRADLGGSIPKSIAAKAQGNQPFLIYNIWKVLDKTLQGKNTTTEPVVNSPESSASAAHATPQLPSMSNPKELTISKGPVKAASDSYGTPIYPPQFETKLRQVEKQFYEEVSREADWTLIGEKDGVKGWSRADGATLGKGVIPHSPNAIFSILADPSKKCLYDTDLDLAKTLKRVSPQCNIDYYLYKAVWPTAARDFCCVAFWKVLDNGTILFLFGEHEDPDCPPVKSNVRGKVTIAVWELVPQNDYKATHVTFMVISELGGSIPKAIQNKVAQNQPFLMNGIWGILDKEPSYEAQARGKLVVNPNAASPEPAATPSGRQTRADSTRSVDSSVSQMQKVDLSGMDLSPLTEPNTSKVFPGSLPNGDILLGTACRTKTIGFISVRVYALGLYVNPAQCCSELSRYQGQSLGALQRDEKLYQDLINGYFRKTIFIILARDLTEDQFSGGISEALMPRLEQKEECSKFVALFKGQSLKNDSVLEFSISTDGLLEYTLNKGDLQNLWSEDLGHAFMKCFFDQASAVGPEGKKSLIYKLPQLLDQAPADEGHTLADELESMRDSLEDQEPGTKRKRGILWKFNPYAQGILIPTWTRRYCDLDRTMFGMKKRKTDRVFKRKVNLRYYTIEGEGIKTGKQLMTGKRGTFFTFTLKPQEKYRAKDLPTFRLSCESEDEGKEWFDLIREAINADELKAQWLARRQAAILKAQTVVNERSGDSTVGGSEVGEPKAFNPYGPRTNDGSLDFTSLLNLVENLEMKDKLILLFAVLIGILILPYLSTIVWALLSWVPFIIVCGAVVAGLSHYQQTVTSKTH